MNHVCANEATTINRTNRKPESEAIAKVREALLAIEKFDTDREFILRARHRYCELTEPHPDEVEAKRSDAGAGIVMHHLNIRSD
ncbi:hypothetical protein [Mesorhizobium sp. M1B.F.Ca.ET.045.04.1.1]|uniref:hypothetical protein n=1 Tax=Mesorhizobium sp. M1B.F.Ca.ET.045.04.1.1 TaxID=2493673 RepID=UPI000F7659B5|nr:hypothetical protein [Mesorhizobium sp. M1B.F.Ca.ET.045.04.1.1]AZO29318.1 hypothetical protein EJ071_19320 [Mesorhizobium sp. M1B.F.Ca.ET.045.04.1.1]